MLQGRAEALNTLEAEGQRIKRVMPDRMCRKNSLVINDESHQCYREKPVLEEETDLGGDEKKEAEDNNAAARVWISGIEAVINYRRLCVVKSPPKPYGFGAVPSFGVASLKLNQVNYKICR